MYGSKPPAARRLAHPLADGGLVARMKSADAGPAAFGSRGLSQLRDLIPKMEAMGYKQQPQSFAKGGMIQGPGTGTSDSIPDEMAPGTYILPADTTKKLALDDKKVPVRVSNGEYELPPEQVQAVGAAVLDAIKGVTHAPKSLSARGLQPPQDEQFFATGGSVRDPEELRKMIPQVEAMGYKQSPAAAPAPVARPNSFGDAAAVASSPGTTQVANAVKGANDAAMRFSGEPLRPEQEASVASAFEQQQRDQAAGAAAAQRGVFPMFGVGSAKASEPPAPTSQTNPAAAPASTSLANAGRGVANPPTVNPSAPAPTNAPAAAPEVMPGVYRHGRGQYSDNAAGMGMPANFTGQPSAQNMAAGESLAARSQQASMGRALSQPAGFQPSSITAPTVLHSGNSWQARNDLRNLEVSASSITNNGGRFDRTRGNNAAQAAYQSALKADAAARGAQPGLDQTAMRENAGITREGMQQEGATTRTGMQEQGSNAREAGRNTLEQQKVNQAAVTQGIDNRGKTMLQALQSQIATEPDGAKRQGIAQRLREMQGQSTADPYLVVPGGQAVDETGKPYNMPSMVFNRQTQQFVQQPKQGGAAVPTVGTVQQGYRFLGGDPSQPSSWAKS